MNWFSAKILYESEVIGPSDSCQLDQESIFVLLAENEEDAKKSDEDRL